MEWTNVAILIVLGFCAGFVNTISAAGSLIALPALMITGLSSAEANATNRVAVLFQNAAAWGGYKSKGYKTDSMAWWLSAAAIPGAVVGAWFSLKIPDALFNKLLATVMIVFLATLYFNPQKLKKRNAPTNTNAYSNILPAIALYFFIGLYGGFIQAGTGFFMMAGSTLLLSYDLPKANFYKAVVMFCYTLAAFAVFFWKGNINWLYAIVISAGTSAGGWVGSLWTLKVDEQVMKRVISMIVIALAVYVLLLK